MCSLPATEPQIIPTLLLNCLQVAFTSLDLVLHTEALLSAINFLSAVLSSGSASSPEWDTRTKTRDKTMLAKDSQYTHTHTLMM